MPGYGARVDAEAAADVRPDDEGDGLAIVIVGSADGASQGSERDAATPEHPQLRHHSSAAHQLSSCRRRRIEMASPIEVLDLVALLIICTRNTTEICRPDRRLAVPARDVEHIGRLAQPREAAMEAPHQALALRDGRAQMAGAGREIAVVQVIGL